MAREATVSLVEAARLIYRTRTPNDKQIHRVYQQMKAGVLRVHNHGGPPLKWTTTEAALAEFLAASKIEHTLGHPAIEAAKKQTRELAQGLDRSTADHAEETAKLRDVYRGIWRDYFLAVLLRRRMAHRSHSFHRWVVVGQVITLVLLVSLTIASVSWSILPVPPEHAAVSQWIAANTDDFSVTRWFPVELRAAGDGSLVRVQYRYQKESRRWIHTDRTFLVSGEEVTGTGD